MYTVLNRLQLIKMYLGTFYFVTATFIASLHCYDPDDPLKSFGTAAKNYNEAVSEMANANIKKKTSLLDSGKLRSITSKLKALSTAAGPLVLFVSILFEDVEVAR